MLADATLAVLEQYPGIGPVGKIHFLAGAGGFSGSRLWKIEREAGPLCLRRWPAEHPTAERLLFIHGVLAHLGKSGIACIPVPLVNRQGSTFVPRAGHFWELAPWMPGEANFRANPSRVRLAAAMRMLAQIHVAAAVGCTPIQASPTLLSRREQLATLLGGGAGQLAAAVESHHQQPLASRGRRLLAHFGRLAPLTAPRLEAAAKLRVPLFPVIRDLWHDHVLFTGDEVTGIIDFGAMRVDSAACDLSRLLGSLVGDDQAAWDFAWEAYAAIRPLSADERELVRTLDDANVLLAGLNWLTWICVEGRTFENLPAVLARLDETLGRLERR
jgi:homoserine kinase type II